MHDAKRWMTVATPCGAGWRLAGEPVGPLPTLLRRLRDRAGAAPVLFGVDAPIGLPLAYRRPHADFPAFLTSLGPDDPFFQVCDEPGEIGLDRPFFPRVPRRGMRRTDLEHGLGIGAEALLRACERADGSPRAAASLFWTVGASQAGKGAICLWRDVLGPALRGADPPALWPFHGPLATLLTPGRIVFAESYPADAGRQMRLGWTGSKRKEADRQRVAPRLRELLGSLGAQPDPALADAIEAGFGQGGDGEDRFDSLVGLLRMLQVLAEPALEQRPEPPILQWEGWILGRPVKPPLGFGA